MNRTGRKRTRSQADMAQDENVDDGNSADDRSDDDEDQDRRQQSSRWELPPGYSDRNRAFLQAFMAHGALTFPQAQPLLAEILNAGRSGTNNNGDSGDMDVDGGENGGALLRPDEITMEDMEEFVSKAQQALLPLDFTIRSAIDQTRNERLWALVSTDDDAKAHLAVLLTPRKLAFVHRLLAALFDTYNTPRLEALCITEQQAIKLSRPPRSRESDAGGGGGSSSAAAANRDKGLKHSVVLSLLQSLVLQGWFEKSDSGFYAPTTRALLELEPFLVETFNDGIRNNTDNTWQRVKHCAACKDLITVGLRCATNTCMLRLHDRCEAAFWSTQAAAAGGNRTCPHCHAAWGHSQDGGDKDSRNFMGERAITLTDVFRRKRRQGRASEGVDDLMRTVLPRAMPAMSMPFRQSSQSQTVDEADEESGEDGDE